MSTHIPAPYLASELRAGKWTPNILQNEAALRDLAADEMERLHAENETLHVENETLRHKLQTLDELGAAGDDVQLLRTGYAAARLEIASLQGRVNECGAGAGCCAQAARIAELEAQLEAVGAGGVGPLRKRCLHQISESQAQPVAWAIFAENGHCRMWTQNKGHADAGAEATGLPLTALYAAPQPVAQAQAALVIAEAALADIGDADHEPSDDLAWCEARAAQALPRVRAAIAAQKGNHD